MKDSVLIDWIAAGDMTAFDRIYAECKSPFISLFRREQGLSVDDALDLYQETCAALYNNVKTGRLTGASLDRARLQTYINKVGRYILYNKRRKRETPLVFDTAAVLSFEGLEDEPYDKETDEKLAIIRASVSSMPMPCSQILNLVCYEGKSNVEVALIMNYASADTVKTQRSRCMQRLRDAVNKRIKEYGNGQD